MQRSPEWRFAPRDPRTDYRQSRTSLMLVGFKNEEEDAVCLNVFRSNLSSQNVSCSNQFVVTNRALQQLVSGRSRIDFCGNQIVVTNRASTAGTSLSSQCWLFNNQFAVWRVVDLTKYQWLFKNKSVLNIRVIRPLSRWPTKPKQW